MDYEYAFLCISMKINGLKSEKISFQIYSFYFKFINYISFPSCLVRENF